MFLQLVMSHLNCISLLVTNQFFRNHYITCPQAARHFKSVLHESLCTYMSVGPPQGRIQLRAVVSLWLKHTYYYIAYYASRVVYKSNSVQVLNDKFTVINGNVTIIWLNKILHRYPSGGPSKACFIMWWTVSLSLEGEWSSVSSSSSSETTEQRKMGQMSTGNSLIWNKKCCTVRGIIPFSTYAWASQGMHSGTQHFVWLSL